MEQKKSNKGDIYGAPNRLIKMLKDVQLRGVVRAGETKKYGINSVSFRSAAKCGFFEFKNGRFFPKYNNVTLDMAEQILAQSRVFRREWESKMKDLDALEVKTLTPINADSSLSIYSDEDIVKELRQRGFEVSAKKVIEL